MDSTTFKYAVQLPNALFEENRRRLMELFKMNSAPEANPVLLMRGKEELPIDCTDDNYEVIQESCFYYLFGVQELGFHACLELNTGKATLFAPKVDVVTRIFQNPPRKVEVTKKYGMPTMYKSKMEKFITDLKPSTIYQNAGMNLMSQKTLPALTYDWLKKFKVDTDLIYRLICRARAQKSPLELDVMKSAVEATSEGHIEMMRKCKPGMREAHLMGFLRDQGLIGYNVKFKAYPDIVASGKNASVLHYETNNRVIQPKELVLCDCAHRVCGYCADITTTFPSDGKFTDKQRQIYELVLSINRTVQSKLGPGVSWMQMEMLCSRLLIEGLRKLDLVRGDNKELMGHMVNRLFMPHSLGHPLGLDPHDVGLETIMIQPLEEGMIVTVEPGCYFNEMVLNRGAKEWKIPLSLVNMEKVKEYMEVGGVRIEDDIVITKDGIANYAQVPRTVQEIETCMAGGDWKKAAA